MKSKLLLVLLVASLVLFNAPLVHADTSVELTTAESTWLQQNKEKIRVGVEKDYPPFIFADESGNVSGLSYDYLKLVEEKLGVTFKYNPPKSLTEILEATKRGDVEIVSSLTRTPEREQFLSFSNSYIDVKAALFTNQSNYSDLTFEQAVAKGLKISVGKNYGVEAYLKQKYPTLNIVEVDNDQKGLESVLFGQTDGHVADIASASYIVSTLKLSNLGVASETDFSYKLAFASPKDNSMLSTILNKTLKTVSKSEKDVIFNKWVTLKNANSNTQFYQSNTFKVTMLAVSMLVIIIFLLSFLWNLSLRRNIRKKTHELEEVNKSLKNTINEKTASLEHEQEYTVSKNSELERTKSAMLNLLEDLQSDKDRLKFALEGARDGLWDWDIVNNTVYLSPQWKNIFGYKENELHGTPAELLDNIHPDDVNNVKILMKKHLDGKTEYYESEHRVRCKNGSYKWILDRGIVTSRDDSKKPLRFVGTHSDISQRKKLEEELERQSLVASKSENGVIITDANGVTTWVNSGFEKALGYKASEIIGKKPGSVLQGKATSQEDIKNFSIGIKKKMPFTQDITNYTKDGEIIILRCYVSPVYNDKKELVSFIAIQADVTNEIENLRAVERFKIAVEAAYDHMIISDQDGKIIFANRGAEENTGYSKEEIVGNTPALWGRQMPKEFYKGMWHTIKDEMKPFVGEITNKRKDGEKYIAEAHISPILDPTGTFAEYYLGVERDITKIKDIDRTKTEFVSLASHQLRTPLSAVNWYAEMLLAGDVGTLNDEQKKYIDEIYNGNQRMVKLVNALLNVSRLELGTFEIKPEPTDVLAMANSVVKELTPQINSKHQKFVNKSPAKLKKYSADSELLRIIIQNLLSNAVKYTPDKGKIELEINYKNKWFEIIVSDNGYGIPKSQHGKLFGKLFRADNVLEKDTEGTGLGLYIVKSIITQSGGDISFTSALNKGTTFVVKLPATGMSKKAGTKSLT